MEGMKHLGAQDMRTFSLGACHYVADWYGTIQDRDTYVGLGIEMAPCYYLISSILL